MIAYDLQCTGGHSFEGWFENAQEFDRQKKEGLVSCPVCGSSQVERVLSTFGIARHRNEPAPPPAPVQGEPHPIKIFAQYVKNNFENVGADFAKEALKMHYGVSEHRNIRGVSSEKEEETLREEGIAFFKIPLPADGESNES